FGPGIPNNGGLFRSSNEGDTWEFVPSPGFNIIGLALSEKGYILVSFQDAPFSSIEVSTNDGVSWYGIDSIVGKIRDVAISQNGTMYSSWSRWGGIQRSTDNGESWTQLTNNNITTEAGTYPLV